MENCKDPLNSAYVIDGTINEVTPAQMLHEAMTWRCGLAAENIPESSGKDIVDESLDTAPADLNYSMERLQEYISLCSGKAVGMQDRAFEMFCPESFARSRVAAALIDSLWIEGSYGLEDLSLWIDWEWDCGKTGNMAAFYRSVQSVSEYVYDLGIQISGYIFDENGEECRMSCFPALSDGLDDEDEDCGDDIPDKDWETDDMEASDTKVWTVADVSIPDDTEDERDIWMGEDRLCPGHLVQENGSVLLFIPFDSCGFRLGASVLADSLGCSGGLAPNVSDPDYFIDCYEVVREFCEDGIMLSARTVCDGGIATAVKKMCTDDIGAEISLKGLKSAYQENDGIKLLFSEVPGVLVQVRGKDMEYIDMQMLLQDVAYYRIGLAEKNGGRIEIAPENGNGLGSILASLLHAETTEGED